MPLGNARRFLTALRCRPNPDLPEQELVMLAQKKRYAEELDRL
jgi:hypothetical protein